MKKPKPKTSTERQSASDERHRKAGRVQSKLWATAEERKKVNKLLIKLRKSK